MSGVINTLLSLRAAAATYVGPGDIVSGASGWWGLRSYNAAAIGGNCVRLIRASDSTEQTFVTLADGSVDVASITTFLAATTGKVVTLFDQSGNGLDMTQGTDAIRPDFILSGVGSLPVIRFHTAPATILSNTSIGATSQPWTMSAVAKRTTAPGGYSGLLGNVYGLYFSNTSGKVLVYAGNLPDVTASENTFHRLQGVADGASANTMVDGTGSAVDSGTQGLAASLITLGNVNGNELIGDVCEAGLWPSGFDGTQRTNMDSNQSTYWGV